ncbi:MAG TPA: M48 family metalloprotease [Candidatus Angelobacter sp.]|nr:M48 family metalloprotease [Candidatus Angelobacter sp.]
MDFFGQQERAQRQTRLLIWLFGFAVLIVVSILSLVFASIVYVFRHPLFHEAWWNPMTVVIGCFFFLARFLVHPFHTLEAIWDPSVVLWTALATLVPILIGCLYKRHLLAEGGPAVARLLGGRRVDPETPDLDEKKLCNVVSEMAIASGMPQPEVYVLDRERGINSFAAGHTREDVAIGVTFGCVKLLTRDELQGVIAHEFNHVLNGDTRLNMRLMTLAHGLFWPTIVGRILIRGTSEAPEMGDSIFDENLPQLNQAMVPFACFFFVLGSITSPLVRWIKSMICREREWLADAAAVQFTRNPPGIEGALRKIGGLLKQGRLDNAHAESASHFYFVNCVHDSWFGFQSTHPPLPKRILKIDPQFDGAFPHILSLPSQDAVYDHRYEESVRRMRAETAVPEES